MFVPDPIEKPQGPTDFIFPGRAAKVIYCKRCGKAIDISVRFDIHTRRVQANGKCPDGHEWQESWEPHTFPGVAPFGTDIDFFPVQRD